MADVIRIRTPKSVETVLKDIVEVWGYAQYPQYSKDIWASPVTVLSINIYKAFKVKSIGGTDSLGQSWKPLSAARIKEKKDPKNQIPRRNVYKRLIAKGRLIRSLDPQYTPTNPDSIVRLNLDSIEVGTKVPYADFFDQERTYMWNGRMATMPARPLWPEDVDPWVEDVAVALTGSLFKALSEKIIGRK